MTRLSARDLAYVAVFAGIVAAMGLAPAFYPFGQAVPITLQTLGVMLAGSILGWRRGGAALLLLLALVAVGLPLLAGGRGGLGVFAEASSGYLIGWPLGAALTGWLTERAGAPYRFATGIGANVVGGLLLVHLTGIVGLMTIAHLDLSKAIAIDVVFILGDLLKAVVATVVAEGVHRAYPGLLTPRRARVEQEMVTA